MIPDSGLLLGMKESFLKNVFMQAQDMEYHFICLSQTVNLLTNFHAGEEVTQESSTVGMS